MLPIELKLKLILKLVLLNTFRTYEWTKPYQPLDYSFKYMQQILYAQPENPL